jgi:hypothetical protein
VEEAYIGAEEMCKRLQQEPDALLNLEPRVLQGLGFDLITYSPHAALAGFFIVRPHRPRMISLGARLAGLPWHELPWCCRSWALTSPHRASMQL